MLKRQIFTTLIDDRHTLDKTSSMQLQLQKLNSKMPQLISSKKSKPITLTKSHRKQKKLCLKE